MRHARHVPRNLACLIGAAITASGTRPRPTATMPPGRWTLSTPSSNRPPPDPTDRTTLTCVPRRTTERPCPPSEQALSATSEISPGPVEPCSERRLRSARFAPRPQLPPEREMVLLHAIAISEREYMMSLRVHIIIGSNKVQLRRESRAPSSGSRGGSDTGRDVGNAPVGQVEPSDRGRRHRRSERVRDSRTARACVRTSSAPGDWPPVAL